MVSVPPNIWIWDSHALLVDRDTEDGSRPDSGDAADAGRRAECDGGSGEVAGAGVGDDHPRDGSADGRLVKAP